MIVLSDYQRDAVEWSRGQGRALGLLDQVGLGKSHMSNAIAQERQADKILYLSPNVLLCKQLKAEIFKYDGSRAIYLRKAEDYDPSCRYFIASYRSINTKSLGHIIDIIGADAEKGVLIADECQAWSNPQAKQTQAWQRWLKFNGQWACVFMSGTAIKKSPLDIISIFKTAGLQAETQLLGQLANWQRRKMGRREWMECTSWKDPARAKAIIMSRCIRRTTADVGLDDEIPPMRKMTLDVDITENAFRRELQECVAKDEDDPDKAMAKVAAIENYLDEGEVDRDSPISMRVISAALEAVSNLKVKPCADFLLTTDDIPTIVFCPHKRPLNALAKLLKKDYAFITGDYTESQRQGVIEDLRLGKVRIILATYDAASTGLNLTECKRVVCISRPWSPAVFSQALGRVRRRLQKDITTCHTLIGVDAGENLRIETTLDNNHARKNEASAGAGLGVLA